MLTIYLAGPERESVTPLLRYIYNALLPIVQKEKPHVIVFESGIVVVCIEWRVCGRLFARRRRSVRLHKYCDDIHVLQTCCAATAACATGLLSHSSAEELAFAYAIRWHKISLPLFSAVLARIWKHVHKIYNQVKSLASARRSKWRSCTVTVCSICMLYFALLAIHRFAFSSRQTRPQIRTF